MEKTRDLRKDLATLLENNDFWTFSRNQVIISYINKNPVLDAGCGAGALTKDLIAKNFDVWASDLDARLCNDIIKNRIASKNRVFVWDISKELRSKAKIPKFGTVVLADVIEHVKNDAQAIKNCSTLLKKNSDLILSVPHDQKLWNVNDIVRCHVRRYGREEIKKLLEKNGFTIKLIRFRNLAIVPAILLSKLFNIRIPHEEISKTPVNSFLMWYFRNIEDKLLLPYGSEMIIVATKNS